MICPTCPHTNAAEHLGYSAVVFMVCLCGRLQVAWAKYHIDSLATCTKKLEYFHFYASQKTCRRACTVPQENISLLEPHVSEMGCPLKLFLPLWFVTASDFWLLLYLLSLDSLLLSCRPQLQKAYILHHCLLFFIIIIIIIITTNITIIVNMA